VYIEDEHSRRRKPVAGDDGVKQSGDRTGLATAGSANYCAMASHKLVDIDKRRNRICIGETAYLKALRRSLGAIEKLKVTFGEKMNRIIYRRMLSEPPLKCVPATGFSNQLNGHPAAPVLFFVTKTLGYGTGSDLRDHSV
jgi:hypothetical protein